MANLNVFSSIVFYSFLAGTSLIGAVSFAHKPVQAERCTFLNPCLNSIPSLERERRDPQASSREGFTRQDWDRVQFGDGIFLSSEFSEEEIAVIRSAMDAALARVRLESTASCVVEYTSDNRDSEERARWNQFTSIISSGGEGGNAGWRRKHIYIDRLAENSNTLGRVPGAEFGVAEGHGDFYFLLNVVNMQQAIDDPGSFAGQTNAAQYAGVIIHEMLHNLGFSHSENVVFGPDNRTNVAGNYTYEAGWCIARGNSEKPYGQFGLVGLNDSDREISRGEQFFIDGNLIATSPPPATESATSKYLVGDWDGDGRDNVAYRRGHIIQMDTNFDSAHDIEMGFGNGNAEDEYLVGDWDGDGRDNIAVRRGHIIQMDTNFDGAHDIEMGFGNGNAEDEYLVGDWDGDGRDNIAVRRGHIIYKDTDFDGAHDLTQGFGNGNAANQYLVGDWDGDGRDNIAAREGHIIYMDNNFDGAHDKTQGYGNGNSASEYLAGDWDGDGRDNIAARERHLIYMDTNFDGAHDIEMAYGDG